MGMDKDGANCVGDPTVSRFQVEPKTDINLPRSAWRGRHGWNKLAPAISAA